MIRHPIGIIVGAGRAGTYLQRGAFLSAGADIIAYVDIDAEQARKAAEDYGVPHSYLTLEAALEKHTVDFVSICTPVELHLEQAALAIRAGCHVLIEKPITSSLEQAIMLKRLAEEAGSTVCVVHNHKFYPGIQRALKLHREDAIGEVLHIERQMTFIHSKARMMEPEHWAHDLPGGRLFEANPHNLYLTYEFVGKMHLEQIRGKKVSKRWPHVQIDEFTATLSANRAIVQITMSLNLEPSSHYPRHGPNFMVITGTKGTLLVSYQHCVYLEQALRANAVGHLVPGILRLSPEIILTLARRFLQRGQRGIVDFNGIQLNDGSSSGHRQFIERFIGYLQKRYSETPTTWNEVLETERLNVEMGRAVEGQLQGN